MKSKNLTPGYLALAVFLSALAFFSCRKEATGHDSKNDLSEAVMSLSGKKLVGSATIVVEGNESAIVFNNENKLVIIGISKGKPFDTGAINAAELVVSKYGVVVKDISKGAVWLLVNNDDESERKFASLRRFFPSANYSAAVFDVMEINTEG
jgi:hypothetical protein